MHSAGWEEERPVKTLHGADDYEQAGVEKSGKHFIIVRGKMSSGEKVGQAQIFRLTFVSHSKLDSIPPTEQ